MAIFVARAPAQPEEIIQAVLIKSHSGGPFVMLDPERDAVLPGPVIEFCSQCTIHGHWMCPTVFGPAELQIHQ